MSATFPRGIRTFTTKRNLLDDVDASHINDIQDEIKALEQVLGLNPHQDTSLVNTPSGAKAPVNQWTTVADRLKFLQRRQDIPVFSLFRDPPQTFPTSKVIPRDRHIVTFPKPSATNDTHALFNGSTGVTIKRTGYYNVFGACRFPRSSLKGVRELTLRINNYDAAYSAVTAHTGTGAGSHVWLNTTWVGRLNVNDKVMITVSMQSEASGFPGGKYTIENARLGGHLIRDI